MLVLSRNVGEIIVIGDGPNKVIIKILRTGPTVSLGIEAPKTVPVHRGEIFSRIEQEWKQTAESRTHDRT